MSNPLDEMKSDQMMMGRDVRVIPKQIPVTAGLLERAIPFLLAFLAVGLGVFGIICRYYLLAVAFIVPVLIYKKLADVSAYFSGLEQRINGCASEIDNYMEQRVVVLTNAAKLIEKSIDLDRKTFVDLARYRSGHFSAGSEAELEGVLKQAEQNIEIALENYPELQSHQVIAEGLAQNNYLQKEITAARSIYNDAVYQWNREIFVFPFHKIVAAKEGRTTRVPFIAPGEIKEAARGVFF